MDDRQGGLRTAIEALFAQQVDDLTASAEFRALEDGRAAPEQYDAFIENVARAHLRSPQLLAFLYALAPPAAAADLLHNLLEELGLDEAGRPASPRPARRTAGGRRARPSAAALEARGRRGPPPRGGRAAALRLAARGRAGRAHRDRGVRVHARRACRAASPARWPTHRGLPARALAWFTHHSEVDIRHAEQGLADLEAYARYYDFDDDEALTIVEMALRENVFTRRYFRDFVTPAGGGDEARGGHALRAAHPLRRGVQPQRHRAALAPTRSWCASATRRGWRGSARGLRVPT